MAKRIGSIKTTSQDLQPKTTKKPPSQTRLEPKCIIKHQLESDEVVGPKEPEGPQEKELRQIDHKIKQQFEQAKRVEAINSSLFKKSYSFEQMYDNTMKKSKELNRLRCIKNIQQLSVEKAKMKVSRKEEQLELKLLQETQQLTEKLESLNSYHQAILKNTQNLKLNQKREQLLYEEAIQNHLRLEQQYQVAMMARNSAKEKARTLDIQQRELDLCQSESSLQVVILSIQTNKKIRFSFTTSDYQQAHKNILSCTAWKHKSKHVLYQEMKFYMISRLFPGMSDIAAKWTVNSQIFPFMFFNRSGPIQSQIDRLDKKIFQDISTRKTAKVDKRKIFFAFGHTDGNPVEDFKNNLKRDLTNFEGYLLHIKSVEFSRVNSVVELINIQYMFDEKPATRLFYLIDIGNRPNGQTITSLVQKNKVTQISKLLTETIGNQRTGFISVKIPRHFPPEDEKTYLEIYEVMRRDK